MRPPFRPLPWAPSPWLPLAAAIAVCVATPASAEPIETLVLPLAETGFSIRLPKAETVAYRGAVSFDTAAGPSAQILYPAVGGIAGFVAALATHGALVEAAKSEAKAKLLQDADKVLDPYKDVLAGFTNKELAQRSLSGLGGVRVNGLIEPNDTGEGWILESLPVFSMTQDRSALVLEHQVSLYAAHAPGAVRYQNVVKVVSDIHDAPDLQTFWSMDAGRNLKEESASLFAYSLNLLVQAASGRQAEAGSEKLFATSRAASSESNGLSSSASPAGEFSSRPCGAG